MRLSTASIGFTRRSFATSSQSFLTKTRPSSQILTDRTQLHQHFRRTYADLAPAKKPRRFRYFTYLWRLTYLSIIAGSGYLAYGVYELRHPDDQFESDPTKKNLVILGKRHYFPEELGPNWMYAKLARHRNFDPPYA